MIHRLYAFHFRQWKDKYLTYGTIALIGFLYGVFNTVVLGRPEEQVTYEFFAVIGIPMFIVPVLYSLRLSSTHPRQKEECDLRLLIRSAFIFRPALVLPILLLLLLIGILFQYLIFRVGSKQIIELDSTFSFRDIIEWLALLGSICVARIIALFILFYKGYKDYLWKAIRATWLFLLADCIINWVIVVLAFEILRRKIFSGWSLVEILPIAILLGNLVVLLPAFINSIIAEKATIKWLENPFIKALLFQFHQAWTHRAFAWQLQHLIQQDSYDFMNAIGWWNISGLEPRTVHRRIRILYELHKIEIAIEHRKPRLIIWDVDHYPGQKFYVLVKHLGRSRLRQEINTPPYTRWNWAGEERRRVRRFKEQDITHPKRRAYDDPIPIAEITENQTEIAENQIFRRIAKVGCSSLADLVDGTTIEIPPDKLILVLESLVKRGVIKQKPDIHETLYELNV